MPATNKPWSEVRLWRRQMRETLVAQRLALTPDAHAALSRAINTHLEAAFALPAGSMVGFCWPFKNEFDTRFAIRRWRERGAQAALPVVIEKNSPLQFRAWWPGAPLLKGVYDIPYPDGTVLVVPDIAFVPMNGFDEGGYRLGYGGGYFDRTLAAQSPKVVAVGIGFEFARLASIEPQPHDIAMDFVVTEAGVHAASPNGLQRLEPAAAAARVQALFAARGLPRRRAEAASLSSPTCYAAEFAEGGTNDRNGSR